MELLCLFHRCSYGFISIMIIYFLKPRDIVLFLDNVNFGTLHETWIICAKGKYNSHHFQQIYYFDFITILIFFHRINEMREIKWNIKLCNNLKQILLFRRLCFFFFFLFVFLRETLILYEEVFYEWKQRRKKKRKRNNIYIHKINKK